MKQVMFQKLRIGLLYGIPQNNRKGPFYFGGVNRKQRASQASLELVVALIAVTMLFVGITRIWVWSKSIIIHRVPAYNNTRVAAGSSNPGFWKVYTPKELTDEWVFKGNPYAGSDPIVHTPGSPTSTPFAGWCVGGDCGGEASAKHVGVSGYNWDFSVDLSKYDLSIGFNTLSTPEDTEWFAKTILKNSSI